MPGYTLYSPHNTRVSCSFLQAGILQLITSLAFGTASFTAFLISRKSFLIFGGNDGK